MIRATLAAVVLALAACQTPQQAAINLGAPPPTAAAPGTVRAKVDATITKSAKALTGSCHWLQSGLALAELFINNQGVRVAYDAGEQALADYCAGQPPTDVSSALVALARAYAAVIASGVPQPSTPTIAPVVALQRPVYKP